MTATETTIFRTMINKYCDLSEQGNPFAEYLISDLSVRLEMWISHGSQIATVPMHISPTAQISASEAP